MVYRVYVEKKPEFANEARSLYAEIRDILQISALKSVRVINRYDVENLDKSLFDYAVKTVFSEPQVDTVSYTPEIDDAFVFAVEYLPGQYDQRADSAAQCVQILSQGERPTVRTARVFRLYGSLTVADIVRIKKHLINPVEAREASLELPETLAVPYDIPTEVALLEGFRNLDAQAVNDFIDSHGLAMDAEDLAFCQTYFRQEQRDPTITEIRMIDTYWSDHCRHTTFNTTIDSVSFADAFLQSAWEDYLRARRELGRTKPINLMDIGTLAAKYLKAKGQLTKLDESDEINACTVKIEVEADGVTEPWLLLFKNETHNHPTEIEPFGGAATCIGGAIRDPLSGRSYVYAAMRLTGAADPRKPLRETLPGKLSQRKIVTTAAAGYSSYGNQIGLATGLVDELYHPGYAAKRMEIGAVVAATPAANVRRECPAPGDVVILLGGRTGRDGCGGATGSSKSHTVNSLETCGAEVQKGNAPEERKLQRLFRNSEACRMIKRCNDFGAGGVSVAIGELADGLSIDLNAVPKKYEGLDGTELAISESQERMAVVVEPADEKRFIALAEQENIEASTVAVVTADPRLVMRWNGKEIVNVSRAFLDTNGAEKHITIEVAACEYAKGDSRDGSCSLLSPEDQRFSSSLLSLAADLKVCSRRGLSERFDSTIGAGTVLLPFGGKNQQTPIQAMVHKISLEEKHTDDCSVMAWGYNPYISEKSPYHGAYLAVVESVAKLLATGASFEDVYLSFQEYFPRPGRDPKRWGPPLAALLGAFEAQMGLGVAAIGGKDSMSGSFEALDVPPTLVSFAVTTEKTQNIISNDFKSAGNPVVLLQPDLDKNGLPTTESLKANFRQVTEWIRTGRVVSVWTLGVGGIAEAVLKMSFGNGFGFCFDDSLPLDRLFAPNYGAFVLELAGGDTGTVRFSSDPRETGEKGTVPMSPESVFLGTVTQSPFFSYCGEQVSAEAVLSAYESTLESVYPCNIPQSGPVETISYSGPAASLPRTIVKKAPPRVLIPVFPGTNCEYDSARAVREAGAEAKILVVKNQSAEAIARSVETFAAELRDAQMIFLPGGFSGGDEPDGSGKFITAFFRNGLLREEVTKLLDDRGGLICGICNGFQALIKLGLVPYGKIMDTDETCPTLTFNTIARHQSRVVRTRIASTKSPWLSLMRVGDIVHVPISHGEGRFVASEELLAQLIANGQIATQYVDDHDQASCDIRFNPNNSLAAIEGITSPDGRVFGKMGHSERVGDGLYKNLPGNYNIRMFEAAVRYFK